jgi:hypothetical protein
MKKSMVMLMVACTALGLAGVRQVEAAPLTVHPSNPRYFTDGSGRAVYVTGSHSWCLVQMEAGFCDRGSTYEYMEGFLDFAQSHGHNYIRLWVNMAYMTYSPWPWQRTGPGTANDGGAKFDMTMFDEAYFARLRERVLQATGRGFVVSVLLFGSGISMREPARWSQVAWNEENNVNPEMAGAFDAADGSTFFTADEGALEIQRSLVRRTVDELNDIENLVWEIINEAKMPESVQWQYDMIDYVRQYESTLTNQHLVGMTSSGWEAADIYLEDGPADWISPDNFTGYYEEGGPGDFTQKVVISDTDHLWTGWSNPEYAEAMRAWVWKTFTRGHNPIFMDSYDADFCVDVGGTEICNDGAVNPVFDGVRDAMGATLAYAGRMDLAPMVPSDGLASTSYLLANPGVEYLAYQPDSGPFTIDLAEGEYGYEWFDPSAGSVASSGTLTASGGTQAFTPPFEGDAVLYLRNEAVIVDPPPESEDVPEAVDADGDPDAHGDPPSVDAHADDPYASDAEGSEEEESGGGGCACRVS